MPEHEILCHKVQQKLAKLLFSMRLPMTIVEKISTDACCASYRHCAVPKPPNRIHLMHCSIHPSKRVETPFKKRNIHSQRTTSLYFCRVYFMIKQKIYKENMNLSSKREKTTKKSYFLFEGTVSFNEHTYYVYVLSKLLSLWIHMSKN